MSNGDILTTIDCCTRMLSGDIKQAKIDVLNEVKSAFTILVRTIHLSQKIM